MGLGTSFSHFGTVPKSPRWSWSARSSDGKTVAIVLWKDGIDYRNRPAVYSDFEDEGPPAWAARPGNRDRLDWMDRPGNRERLANMIWARDRLDGVLRVVIAVAHDVSVEPRTIADCYPVKWTMRLVDLDEATGRFRAHMMELPKQTSNSR